MMSLSDAVNTVIYYNLLNFTVFVHLENMDQFIVLSSRVWPVSRTRHNHLRIIKMLVHARMGNMKLDWPATRLFANSIHDLNTRNDKSKFIHHGRLTVRQQPVISC